MQHHKHEKENLAEIGYDDMTKFENFVRGNLKTIMRVAFGLVVVLLIGLIFMKVTQSISNKASAEFGKAQTIEELKTVIADHPNHPAVELAKLKLAALYVNDKKYDDAQKLYGQLAKSADTVEVAPRAKLNESYLLEIMGKKEEAAAKFADAGGNMSLRESFRLEANYNAARIYSGLGNKDKAKTSVEKITFTEDRTPNQFWFSKAKALKETL